MEEPAVAAWLAALERRHLQDLRFAEVRRGLQALSSLYVARRQRLGRGGAFEGAGKRAAFALFYGPLHFLTVRGIAEELHGELSPLRRIVEPGCGTGAAAAAWALATPGRPKVEGIERHPWAVDEARWTLRQLGVAGSVRRGLLEREARLAGRGEGLLLAWTVNELEEAARAALLERVLVALRAGAALLVVEPIARRPAPWWPGWAEAVAAEGGREDRWRLPLERPPLLERLDRAAGLDHRTLTARSLWAPGDGSRKAKGHTA